MVEGEDNEVNTESQNDAGQVRVGEEAARQGEERYPETREGAAEAGGYNSDRVNAPEPFEQKLKPAAGQFPDAKEDEEQPRNSTLDEAEGEDKDGNEVDNTRDSGDGEASESADGNEGRAPGSVEDTDNE